MLTNTYALTSRNGKTIVLLIITVDSLDILSNAGAIQRNDSISVDQSFRIPRAVAVG